jgi:DNA-binding CsgD family transcriptional regulator
MRATVDGRFVEAEQLAEEARLLGLRVQHDNAEQFYLLQIFAIRRGQGHSDAVAPGLLAALASRPHLPHNRIALAVCYADTGNLVQARREFERLAAMDFADLPADHNYIALRAMLAEVAVAIGDERRASLLYDQLAPYATRLIVISRQAIACLGAVAHVLGQLAQSLGRSREAARHFEDSLDIHARIGAEPALARSRYTYAGFLLAQTGKGLSEDRERAAELLNQAIPTADELGMVRLAEQARGLRATVGPSRTSSHRAVPNGLTAREAEVLHLLSQGKSNREIAEALVVTVNTVERHLVSAYGKIGVRGRAAATAYALRHGLG